MVDDEFYYSDAIAAFLCPKCKKVYEELPVACCKCGFVSKKSEDKTLKQLLQENSWEDSTFTDSIYVRLAIQLVKEWLLRKQEIEQKASTINYDEEARYYYEVRVGMLKELLKDLEK